MSEITTARGRWGRAHQLVSAALLVGCTSTHEHPPFSEEENGEQDASAATSEPVFTAPVATSECGETVELPIIRPNFYFVLDFSGSMNEAMPESGGATRIAALRDAVHTMLLGVGAAVNFGAAVFPEDDAADGCAPGVELFETEPGDAPTSTGEEGANLARLMSRLRKQAAVGSTPIASTLTALTPKLTALPGKTYAFLITDGAPNCSQQFGCDVDLCIPNIEGAHLTDGTKCDADFNCCAPNIAPYMCLDEDATTTALAELFDAGVPTFVLAMPGTEAYATTLERMARAGGVPSSEESEYYPVRAASELAQTLATLGRQVLAECTLALSIPAERRSQVELLADEQVLELDTDWSWESDASVTLLAETCSRWQAGEIQQIRLQERCRDPLH